jgi:hypothetical protein
VVVAPTTKDLYGEEVAERKSPPATSSRVLPKEAPESASIPSQSPAPPVIAVQKAERVVPEVPKIVRVPPPTERLVVLAVVAKKLVEVAEEEVELTAVKFWRVVEPLTKRVAKVPAPVVSEVEKRLVEEAVVEKKLVVVAFELVELTAVKFWRVEEELAKSVFVVVSPVIVAELTVSKPLALMERAEAVEVAKVEGDEVAIYRMPPAFLKDQWLLVRTEGSERVS